MHRVVVAGLLALSACNQSTALSLPPEMSDGGTQDGPPIDQDAGPHTIRVPQNLKNQIDILFMIDNSSSMDAMQLQLRTRFPQFFKPFGDLADKGTYADVNIGVVTSDYGAGSTGAPGCSPSPGGQLGKLQALGVKASPSCQKPVGANFLHFVFTPPGTPDNNNLPKGQNLLDTFTCMASVGANGCPFGHPLESVYAALRNNLPENAGFLRDDALLAVVFLTNKDDSSARPDSDIFDKNRTNIYGFEDDFRSTRFGVMCGDPLALVPYADSGGPMSNCQPAPDPPGKEYDVARYVTLFNDTPLRGGAKYNPLDVILIGIVAPEQPFAVILSNPGTPAGKQYVQCQQISEGSNPPCVPVLQHSCQNPQAPAFFGDPPIRLDSVIRTARHFSINSICDSNYSESLYGAATQIVSQTGSGCIPDKLSFDPANPGLLLTHCTVEDLTTQVDGNVTRTSIPRCDAGHVFPCWKLDVKPECEGRCYNDSTKVCITDVDCADIGACHPGTSPDGVGLTIDRNGQQAPPHTTASITCGP